MGIYKEWTCPVHRSRTVARQGRPKGFRTGVSLHSHTNQSRETLDFLANFGNQFPVMRPLMSRMERRAEQIHGVRIDYAASYWTPPMTPKLAFDLETRRSRSSAWRRWFRSRTTTTSRRPCFCAPCPARGRFRCRWSGARPTAACSRSTWACTTCPAPARQSGWRRSRSYTANPSDARLTEILVALNHEPNVLVVFNHPMWDLYLIGKEKHQFLVNEFLQKNGAYLHALELNGLRNWDENRAVRRLAEKWNMLLISGGDRHGVEPNANINLTNATSFTEFVHEIRREKKSHVLFMPQYAEPWKHRILQSTIDAIRTIPSFRKARAPGTSASTIPTRNGVVGR
jgi:hypothetical protein